MGTCHTAVPRSRIQLVMQQSHAVGASVPRVSLLYSFSSKRCDVGWSQMFSALAVAARPRRETKECYAVMLPNFTLRNLSVNYILHTSRDQILHCDWTALHCAAGGTAVWQVPRPLPFCRMGSGSRDYTRISKMSKNYVN